LQLLSIIDTRCTEFAEHSRVLYCIELYILATMSSKYQDSDNGPKGEVEALRDELSDLRAQVKHQASILLLFGKLLNKNKVHPDGATAAGASKTSAENKSSDGDLSQSSLSSSAQDCMADVENQQQKGRVEASKRKCRCSKVGFIEFEGSSSPLGGIGLCLSDRQSAGLLVLNCLLTPFLLMVHSVRIYFVPCLQSVVFQCCCAVGSCLCGKCWRYTDKQFPPTDVSLGAFEAKEAKKDGDGVEWKRAHEIIEVMPATSRCDRTAPQLFEDGISPRDIAQGALGDCWLLSAIACLAEQRGAIERCFVEHSYNPRGKYTLRLWSGLKQKWMYINIDDTFPCNPGEGGKPLFTHPNGGEIWVMLLEKAFAKLSGSYANIEGGHVLWALEAMTGDDVLKYSLSKEKTEWSSYELVHKNKTDDEGVRACRFPSTGHTFNNDNMFAVLKKYSNSNCVLGAGSLGVDNTRKEGRSEDEKDDNGGIVPGHAYSILDVRQCFGQRLVCLRNPWGSFEWKGDWSDTSSTWKKHPLVRALLKPETILSRSDKDDGMFWMSWDDFLKYFSSVDVCITSQGLQELSYHVYEGAGFGGPCLGCIVGCFTYWICCCGLYKLWCSRSSRKTFAAENVQEVDGKR
jgi:hypothetical protein